ncbi:hypothetical protein [Oleidesulfovibrio sp.]|uniref:hypothetical protein n=1 Tax=Oleidesulfovibrio sp. TaxID=2909707 RepID=UPI003A876857
MSEKYSVLLMRDDSKVRRFRLSPVWLRLGIYSLILLATMAAGGGYAGYTFWQQNEVLKAEQNTLQRDVRELNMKLERLQNVDKILNSNDPEELQALLGNVTIEQAPPPKPTIDLSALLHKVDVQMVKVDNISARAVNKRSLTLQFDLNNLATDRTLSGEVEVSVLSKQGLTKPAKATNPDDLGYAINRYKKVRANLTIPDSMPIEDVYALIVSINSNDKTIFRDTVPLVGLDQ